MYNVRYIFNNSADSLSFYHIFPIIVRDKKYTSVAHYYFDNKYDSKYTKIAANFAPNVEFLISMLGNLRVNADWSCQRKRIMYEALEAKFIKNKDMRAQLLATGDNLLINECADSYWGVAKSYGRNTYGEILMEIRSNIRANNIH